MRHSTLTPKRFGRVLDELDAIASVELADSLHVLRWTRRPLSDGQASKLAWYLNDELTSGGMLTAGHIRASGVHGATANALERNARALLRAIRNGER
jgi:hypothetical protein